MARPASFRTDLGCRISGPNVSDGVWFQAQAKSLGARAIVGKGRQQCQTSCGTRQTTQQKVLRSFSESGSPAQSLPSQQVPKPPPTPVILAAAGTQSPDYAPTPSWQQIFGGGRWHRTQRFSFSTTFITHKHYTQKRLWIPVATRMTGWGSRILTAARITANNENTLAKTAVPVERPDPLCYAELRGLLILWQKKLLSP